MNRISKMRLARAYDRDSRAPSLPSLSDKLTTRTPHSQPRLATSAEDQKSDVAQVDTPFGLSALLCKPEIGGRQAAPVDVVERQRIVDVRSDHHAGSDLLGMAYDI